MKNGKFSRTSRRRFHARFVAVLVSVMLIFATAVGATLAYLTDSTDIIPNEFKPAQVTSKVEETFQDGVKSDVKIRNTGDVSAFIRAEVLVTWKAEDGSVLVGVPEEGTDYEITYGTDNWFSKDGYFYYKEELAKDGLTNALILEAKAYNKKTDTNGTDYFVSIDILSSAIQSEGVRASDGKHPVEIAWDVAYTDGNPATISKEVMR